jgi:hypothetical protein
VAYEYHPALCGEGVKQNQKIGLTN